ncbi:hypothetical protein [Hyphomicrobium sp. MC1]|uniref:hypothetical protein n=1 Tax=Hyphomicrobium sp. (strain MC1) TaxID=717785 RepID=UPI0012F51ACB|nr:hypothetical protein [Hyphomicrobium sp. MC1]
MFPFLAEYTNKDTGEKAGGLAVPSMVTEPLNALLRLIGTPNHPGTFAAGPDAGIEWDNPVRSQYPAQEDMRTLLETFTGGNATRGMGAVERGAVEAAAPRAATSILPDIAPAISRAEPKQLPLFGDNMFPADDTPGGITLWHGSPHDFDKFSLNKIGSGEGNQAFGHGLYFAEDPEISKWYARNLASDSPVDRVMLDGQNLYNSGSPNKDLAWYFNDNASPAQALKNAQSAADRARSDGQSLTAAANEKANRSSKGFILSNAQSKLQEADRHAAAADQIQSLLGSGRLDTKPTDYLYQVKVNAEPHQFLDWETLSPETRQQLKSPEGAQSYRDQGYAGIRYKDANSRGIEGGNYNYVVIDDNLVNVVHKWNGNNQLFSDNLPSLPGAVIAGAEKGQPSIFNRLRSLFQKNAPDSDVTRAQELYHQYPGEMSALPPDIPNWVFVPKNEYNWNNYPNRFFGDDNAIKKSAVNIGDDQAPIGPNDQSYLNALLRQRKVDDGSLYSDQLPSIWGAALAGSQQPKSPSLFNF